MDLEKSCYKQAFIIRREIIIIKCHEYCYANTQQKSSKYTKDDLLKSECSWKIWEWLIWQQAQKLVGFVQEGLSLRERRNWGNVQKSLAAGRELKLHRKGR